MLYINKITEADIQCRLFKALVDEGLEVYAEYKITKKQLFGARGCRFDLVVSKDRKIEVIIEVKNSKKPYTPKKVKYYKEVTKLPVLVCHSLESIPAVVKSVVSIISKTHTNIV